MPRNAPIVRYSNSHFSAPSTLVNTRAFTRPFRRARAGKLGGEIAGHFFNLKLNAHCSPFLTLRLKPSKANCIRQLVRKLAHSIGLESPDSIRGGLAGFIAPLR